MAAAGVGVVEGLMRFVSSVPSLGGLGDGELYLSLFLFQRHVVLALVAC